MKLTLKVWRQKNSSAKGAFETFQVDGISKDMSFLEMFDVLNERLINEGKEPIAFDHDCPKASVECAPCTSTVVRTDHGKVQLPVSCTCAPSTTAIPSW